MAVEGRVFRPVVDHDKCGVCSICIGTCPAGKIPDLQKESESVRGKIYGKFGSAGGSDAESGSPIPHCQRHCPIDQDVSGYISLISQREFAAALSLIRKTNPLPSVCGYVCHRPCESACFRSGVDKATSIRSLKRWMTELAPNSQPSTLPFEKTGRTIAIIGSGPAGMTAAHDLTLKGHKVEIYESHSEPGGMLAWAIPEFRLPRQALQRDVDYIKQMGVVFRTNRSFGTDFVLNDLWENGTHAVIIATGTMKSTPPDFALAPKIKGVVDCLDFLKNSNGSEKALAGSSVLVIGGGNAALDSARVAVRSGADQVRLLYRRGRLEMPADPSEIGDALNDGIRIMFQTLPVGLIDANGKIKGLECMRTELIDNPKSGRRTPVPVENSNFTIDGDWVITAIGQDPDYDDVDRGIGQKMSSEGWTEIKEETMVQSIQGVFATGDFINGAGTVVEAMASGRRTAQAVDQYLNQQSALKKENP